MGSRTQSHQLSNGLYVSGRADSGPKPLTPSLSSSSRSVIYTGGDIKKSGDLAKMFDLSAPSSTSSQPTTPRPIPSRPNSQPNSGSGPQAQQQPHRLSHNSGSLKKSSGPLTTPQLQPTGLITSGPTPARLSGQLGPGPGRVSGQVGPISGRVSGQLGPDPARLDGPGSGRGGEGGGGGGGKVVYGGAVTNLTKEGRGRGRGVRYGVKVGRGVMWVFGIVVLMGLLVGVFLMVAVKKAVILVAFAGVLVPVFVGLGWNYAWGRRAIIGFVKKFADTELRGAVDGQFVKVTGVVTCGSIPLESSFQRVPRCVYVSTELYEYKGWGGKSANPKHRCFSWGSRYSEKYVADFYISDFHSGLRALVKSGYGAKVAPLVEPATIADITKEKRDLAPNFLQWLADRSLSSDDRIMRLKEGYVKEGSTISVMGVVRRHENVLMIVPPPEPISTGCQWLRCLLPMYVEGLILHCDDSENSEVIPV